MFLGILKRDLRIAKELRRKLHFSNLGLARLDSVFKILFERTIHG